MMPGFRFFQLLPRAHCVRGGNSIIDVISTASLKSLRSVDASKLGIKMSVTVTVCNNRAQYVFMSKSFDTRLSE